MLIDARHPTVADVVRPAVGPVAAIQARLLDSALNWIEPAYSDD